MLCSAFAMQQANADLLTAPDREALLENLEKIRAAADSNLDARFRLAIVAFRNAMRSDEAAMELYLNCLEKVNFSDQLKKPADFREWKRKEGEKLSDPGLKLALRHQLRWLMLTLEAASANPDRPKLAAEAQQIVDTIFREPEKLKNQGEILGQSVTGTVFAKAYDINNVKVDDWALSPIALQAVYDDILLPPVRTSSRLEELRARWIKRIQQESLLMEHLGEGRRRDRGDGREEKRIGTIESMQSPEYLKFMQEKVPELQWEMEKDLFICGDQAGAAKRMLAHLQTNISHASAKKWGDEFEKLLSPIKAGEGPATDGATEGITETPAPADGTVQAQ